MTSYRQALVRDSADALRTALTDARNRALAGGAAYGICFDEQARAYALYEGASDAATDQFPAGNASTSLPTCAAGGIAFSSRSAMTAGARILVEENGSRSVIEVNREGWIYAGE
jgi:hypothetical protein